MTRPRSRAAVAALAAVAVAVAALVGCVALRDSFHCSSDDACTLDGRAGFCESDGLCSAADATCPSGRRYGDAAGARAGQCTTALDLSLPADDLAGDDAGAPIVCPSFAYFCSGFENGSAGFSSEQDSGNVTLAVTTDKPYHGAHSLHATGGINSVDGGGTAPQSAALDRQFAGSEGAGVIGVRAYFYVTAPLGNYGTILWLAGNGMSGLGATPLGTWFFIDPAGEHDSTETVPIGRWFCLEQLVEPGAAGAPARVRAFVDGAPIYDLQSTLTGPVVDFWVGLVRGPGDSAQEVYVDDVAVAAQRVGCE